MTMLRKVFVVLCVLYCARASPFGPPYPVTGSWFKDRFSQHEWNTTLREFSQIGGDTVILRAPSVRLVDFQALREDPNFKWCGRFRNNSHGEDRSCFAEAVGELRNLGLSVVALATYEYEEDFNESVIIQCPQYERKIVTDRVFYRLVLPISQASLGHPCDLNGTDVMVLFTSFAGIDPHALLLQTAQEFNISVYFGLPLPPIQYQNGRVMKMDYIYSYFEFLRRILYDHKTRFNDTRNHYNTLKGYFWSDDFLLTDVNVTIDGFGTMNYMSLFAIISDYVQKTDGKKQFGVPSFYQANVFENSSSMRSYYIAFGELALRGRVNIISVRDGRGMAFGATFWDTQINSTINTTDPSLMKILKTYYPSSVNNETKYSDLYGFSIFQIFDQLASYRDEIKEHGENIELWLNIEAFDDLHENLCLPVDNTGSGMDCMVDSVSKSRLDKILTHAGTSAQKIVASAWDPSFTCRTQSHGAPLINQINADEGRPIIAHCSFHSSANRSVVVIGFNLDAETQGFTIDWPHVNGHRVVSQVHGYYFELDWGVQHQRVPSLMYTQTYDPYNIMQLAPKGYVKVAVDSGYHACTFVYDFTQDDGVKNYLTDMKKYYKIQHKPVYRVYGQDVSFR